jgi:hypothetical protein
MPQIKRTREQIEEAIKTQSKVCCVCDIRKDFNDFYNFKNKSDGKSYRCKECDTAARRKWSENNPERSRYSARNRRLKHIYGVDIDWYEKTLEDQGGGCAICGVKQNRTSGRSHWNFAVDHNHETGEIRGLLCNPCNRAMGMLGDKVESLTRAIEYLKKYETH